MFSTIDIIQVRILGKEHQRVTELQAAAAVVQSLKIVRRVGGEPVVPERGLTAEESLLQRSVVLRARQGGPLAVKRVRR